MVHLSVMTKIGHIEKWLIRKPALKQNNLALSVRGDTIQQYIDT